MEKLDAVFLVNSCRMNTSQKRLCRRKIWRMPLVCIMRWHPRQQTMRRNPMSSSLKQQIGGSCFSKPSKCSLLICANCGKKSSAEGGVNSCLDRLKQRLKSFNLFIWSEIRLSSDLIRVHKVVHEKETSGFKRLFNLAEKRITRCSSWKLKMQEIQFGNKAQTFNSQGD